MVTPIEKEAHDFIQLVSLRYPDLTKSEKRIASYLRKNLDDCAFLSAAEVADRLGVSEATVVRFARNMGYGSYPSLREDLQENFRKRITHSSRLRSKLDDLRQAGDIFEKLTVSEIDYLTQALETVNRGQLHQAVELLKERDRIYVFGLGPSITLVDLLELRLKRSGKVVIPLTDAGREVLENLLLMGSNDLLFMIGFFDLNPTLNLVMEYAREVGCKIILLTDTLESIIGDKADVVLSASRGPVSKFHSLVVPMTIVNTLLLALANEDQERILPILDKLDSLRERLKALTKTD
jgi:DNA-binding MurR/RpiR family transcriptional regulator